MSARLVTAVVGAGPAGLLFAIAGKLLAAQLAPGAEWRLRVFDKREQYARTHRLRMAPAAYREMARVLRDARFDDLLSFLEETEFSPEVNALEGRLAELLAAVGCRKTIAAIGSGEGELSLAELRARLEAEGDLRKDDVFTIVGADSVHSAVRELVRGDLVPSQERHEQLARIRVTGAGLPRRLGAADQLRLSKVLGSVVDYRLNSNGFAEVDLFLTGQEFDVIHALGANPREPVTLSADRLRELRAPLFRAIVSYLEQGPEGGKRELALYSTFRLEHSRMPRVSFPLPSLHAYAFLVGDAAVSLPFQRGMSCLAHAALSLAEAHVALLKGGEAGDIAQRYDISVAEIVMRELVVVRSRARLVRTLREIVRLSAMLPFPIQSWWLRVDEHVRLRDRFSLWFWLNAAVAVAVFGLAIGGSLIGHALAWVSAPLAMVGGVVYHAALAFEGGPHRLVRRVWEVAIAGLFVAGVGIVLQRWLATGAFRLGLEPFWWLISAAAFVIGLYLFEGWVARWFASAGLSFRDDSAP